MSNSVQYEVSARDDTAATVRIAIPQEHVVQEIESVYAQYANELSVPGFRKGRVPKSVLETRFGRDVFVLEAKDGLERKHLPAALAELALHPVSVPEVQEVSFDPQGAFVFQASFAVLPDVKLAPYRGLEVSAPPSPAVTDDDIDSGLAEIQSQFGTLAACEGDTVSDGDIVRVREKDEEWDARAEQDNPITRALIGHRVGESVDIEAPLETGKRLKTTVEIVGLRQVVLPPIDDEFAKDAGFDTLAALRDDVRRRITDSREDRRRRALETALLDQLVEKTAVPLPEPFVLELVDEELGRIRSALERPDSAMSFARYLEERATTEDDLRKEIRQSVERRLRRELVLGQLGQAEGVAINDDELESLAKADAQLAGEDGLRFVARLKADERWEDYRSTKVTERLLAILREAAVIREKEG